MTEEKRRRRGRPPVKDELRRVRFTVRLPKWLTRKVKNKARRGFGQGKLVEEALIFKHNWKPPKPKGRK